MLETGRHKELKCYQFPTLCLHVYTGTHKLQELHFLNSRVKKIAWLIRWGHSWLKRIIMAYRWGGGWYYPLLSALVGNLKFYPFRANYVTQFHLDRSAVDLRHAVFSSGHTIYFYFIFLYVPSPSLVAICVSESLYENGYKALVVYNVTILCCNLVWGVNRLHSSLCS